MTWIVPFQGRKHSGTFNQNFLFKSGNIYVMDNHRAALWCWLNHFKGNVQGVGIFHLDRHSDALQSNLDSWVAQALGPPHVSKMDIQSYLDTVDSGFPPAKLFRWDNYLSIFLDMYGSDVSSCLFSIYEGDRIAHANAVEKLPWDFPNNLNFWLSNGKWIVNVDLDYFFHEVDGAFEQMYSAEYLRAFFSEVARISSRRADTVVTICFSPECCGGWSNAEGIWSVAESCLNTGLVLPP